MSKARRVRRVFWMGCLAMLWCVPISADSKTPSASGTVELVREKLDHFLRTRASSRVNHFEIPSLDSFDFTVPSPGDLSVAVRTRSTGQLLGRVPVTIVISDGDTEVKRAVVTASLQALENVYVATRSLRRGDVVTQADFRRERRDVSVVRDSVISREDRLLGKRVRRSINAGHMWQARYLESVPTVKRGELVRLRLETGGLRIDGRGKASEDGSVGDWIRVLNSASNRIVMGQVGEEGSVYVRF